MNQSNQFIYSGRVSQARTYSSVFEGYRQWVETVDHEAARKTWVCVVTEAYEAEHGDLAYERMTPLFLTDIVEPMLYNLSGPGLDRHGSVVFYHVIYCVGSKEFATKEDLLARLESLMLLFPHNNIIVLGADFGDECCTEKPLSQYHEFKMYTSFEGARVWYASSAPDRLTGWIRQPHEHNNVWEFAA